MMKRELTKEESQHLIDLGVPEGKASILSVTSPLDCDFSISRHPIFRLEDFLNGEILPKEIEDDTWGFIYKLRIGWDSERDYEWLAGYNGVTYFRCAELIDALYKLACWYYGEYLKSEKK